MSKKWLSGKVCIVTGGASGIGEAIAIKLATNGGIVVVADKNEEKGKTVVSEMVKSGSKAFYVPTDVTQVDEVRVVVEKAKQYGPIQFLANSAGLQTYGTAESTSESSWDLTMDVNLKSMYLMAKSVIPEIRNNGGGAIVNISSVQGIRSQKNVLAYATSKAGAIALTRCMGLDHASEGIRVNCICPGSVDTPLLRFGATQHGDEEEVLQEWGRHHPIGRIGTAEEIASLAIYLMSPEASFIVGQAIVADGGLGSIIL
ncbi:MAG: glucose 1-dehydrogenase [Bacteroidota bacterium]